MSRYVIGDIHGAHKALIQCFDRSEFDYSNDILICLGDICDGWPEVYEVFEELLKIKNLIYILGNHDYWTREWMKSGISSDIWLKQGGWATVNSYKSKTPESHKKLLENAFPYFKTENLLFVHGGFNDEKNIEEQSIEELIWNRSLVYKAISNENSGNNSKITSYDEIYIGHTPTLNYNTTVPEKACEVWLLDTGAGWPGGVLSMMNIDTKELFQSENVQTLYPESPGRNKFF